MDIKKKDVYYCEGHASTWVTVNIWSIMSVEVCIKVFAK